MVLPRLGHDPRESRDADAPPVEWVPALGCWCVFEVDEITSILKSTDFVAAEFADWHRALDKMGIDCSAVIEILDHVATANEGQRHAEIRETMARCIAAQTPAVKTAVAGTISELVHLRCRDGQRVDLVREIIQPACDTLFETLLGAPGPSDDEGISVSQIFDLYLSLNRRKQIVSKAGTLLGTYREAQDRLNVGTGYTTALRILGYDSIVGSLGGSMLQMLEDAPGERLCDISYPTRLPKTGVPYIEKFAATDRMVGDAAIKKGDRIRLYLDTEKQGDHTSGQCLFGRGRHSCLGEDLSSWFWRTLTAEFSKVPLRFTIESAVRRKPDWVFAYYSNITVDFHA